MPRIAILTPAHDYPAHLWAGEAERFRTLLGADLDFRCWDDVGDLLAFDLVMPLLAWGYHTKAGDWFCALDRWEADGVRVSNSPTLLRWNTDKDYLLDLEAAGVSIVPTIEAHGLQSHDLELARAEFGCGDLIIKPSMSAGADRTYLIGKDDLIPFDALEKEMLIQPVMSAIMSEGEFSLFAFEGEMSHAIVKRPATGDFRVQEQFGGREFAVETSREALELAQACLAALDAVPIYARIDMVRDDEGRMRLMELELIEPALFLQFAPDGGTRFVDAVQARIRTA